MRKLLFVCCTVLLFVHQSLNAQQKLELKEYREGHSAGEITILSKWFENDARQSAVVYRINTPFTGSYQLQVIANAQQGAGYRLFIDGKGSTASLSASVNGWQKLNASAPFIISAGIHEIKLSVPGNIFPMVDDISFSRSGIHTGLEQNWQKLSAVINRALQHTPVNNLPTQNNETAKVLPNPNGNYEHHLDTGFVYSTFVNVFLTGGQTYTFTTSNSTVDPVLHVFCITPFAQTTSYYGDSYNSTWEGKVTFTPFVSGQYGVLVRPFVSGETGITTVKQNGVNIAANSPIGGKFYWMTQRTGDLNYFTTNLTGTGVPDTRLFTLMGPSAPVTGYNDDYSGGGGNWNWGRASRIKKNYAVGSYITYVCAYSTTSTGKCDIYMGNRNGELPAKEPWNFPLLMADDAIQSAPTDGQYNCIAWSGGVTSYWMWPPSWSSTWNCAAGDNSIACFDKFYSNTPAPRYPGAWNYTRTGATEANAVIDVWAIPGGWYKHGSVRRPGNNHPHGYDWESKPGGLDRTFHPRYALNNPDFYGAPVTFYIHNGTYSRMAGITKAIESDADAIKAGLAIYEPAKLSTPISEKLNGMVRETERTVVNRFEELYKIWKATWEKNASQSDPDAYCQNKEFEELYNFCRKQGDAALVQVFDKYVNGDHFIGKIAWEQTRGRYARLLEEAKNDYLNNMYDTQGRFKLNGDHDNGVRYIEKILTEFEMPRVATTDDIQVTVSPNPVQQQLNVVFKLNNTSRVEIKAVSAQTHATRKLLAEQELVAGLHRYSMNIPGFAGGTGDIVTIQVTVNNVVKTVKAMVTK